MSTILHSLYGKLFGVDASGYITGPVGAKFPSYKFGPSGSEADLTGASTPVAYTSTGETLASGGVLLLNPSSAASYTLPAPTGTGKEVTLISHSASTSNNVQLSSASGTFRTTSGSSLVSILFKAAGAAVTVVDISTIWQVTNIRGTTDTVTVTSGA